MRSEVPEEIVREKDVDVRWVEEGMERGAGWRGGEEGGKVAVQRIQKLFRQLREMPPQDVVQNVSYERQG